MKIKSKLLRAAKHCQGKSDIRYYLNGIHIYGNIVESTNGHVAVQMTMDKKIRGNFILNIIGVIPAKALWTKFIFHKSETIAKHYDSCEQLISVSCVDVIDGNFPDINRVIPNKFKPIDYIGLNTEYVGLFGKMFGKNYMSAAKFQFSDKNSAVLITAASPIVKYEFGNPKFVVMPARLDDEKV
jgi:DNA polymerase-3 subunit beta